MRPGQCCFVVIVVPCPAASTDTMRSAELDLVASQELDLDDCHQIPADAWEQLPDDAWPALRNHEGVPEEHLERLRGSLRDCPGRARVLSLPSSGEMSSLSRPLLRKSLLFSAQHTQKHYEASVVTLYESSMVWSRASACYTVLLLVPDAPEINVCWACCPDDVGDGARIESAFDASSAQVARSRVSPLPRLLLALLARKGRVRTGGRKTRGRGGGET